MLRTDLANTSDVNKGDALVGFRQPLTGANGSTVHHKLSEYISVKDFGARGDGRTDDSGAFQNALNSSKSIHVPAGTYLVKDLNPPSECTIMCEGFDAIIKGVSEADTIFKTTEFRSLLHVIGGRWECCKYVWHHNSDHSLSNCLFESMFISCCENGFRINAAVGNVWRNIRVKKADYGWYLGEGTENVINTNKFLECNLLAYRSGGIYFVSNESKPMRGNIIRSCWFEDSDHSAIFAGGGSSHLVIADCYFESTGSTEDADIVLNQLGSESIKPTVIIDSCHFAAPKPSQRSRLMVQGDVALLAKDNIAVLRRGDIFARIETPNRFVIQLINNLLDTAGDGTYESWLYQRDGMQDVRWAEYWLP